MGSLLEYTLTNEDRSLILTELLVFSLFILAAYLMVKVTSYFNIENEQQRKIAVLSIPPAKLMFVLFLFFIFNAVFSLYSDDGFSILYLMLSLVLSLSVIRTSFSLATFIAMLILRPWEIRPDLEILEIIPRVSFILFLFSYLMEALQKGRLNLKKNPIQVFYLILGFWVYMSTFVSSDILQSQVSFFEGYMKSLIIAFAIFQGLESHDDYEVVTDSLLISALGVSAIAILNTNMLVNTSRLEGKGALENANDLAALLILVLPFSIKGFLHKRITFFNVFISILTIGLLFVGVWKAQSRAAYIAIGAMGAGYFGYHFRHNKKILRVGVLVCLIGAVVLSQLNLGRSSDDLQDSKMNRLGYWKAGISMAIRNPVFGVGLDQFPKNYGMYGAANFSEGGDRTAHSSWILILSETGFPGLFFLLIIYLLAINRGWLLADRIPELLLCLLGYGVTMSFLSHSYVLYPYLLTALCFAYPQDIKGDDS